jgi:hypothetical protein
VRDADVSAELMRERQRSAEQPVVELRWLRMRARIPFAPSFCAGA